MNQSPQLLVSVRSAREAMAAIEGGADLIDIKEPERGPLGRADDRVVLEIVSAVAGVRPVSMAGGELLENASFLPFAGFIKIGLAGCRFRHDWPGRLSELNGHIVPVAYADRERAESPRPETVLDFAIQERCSAFAIDTWGKDGSNLLDWCSLETLGSLCQTAHDAGLKVAFAGSLSIPTIARVLAVRPDVIAVRSAACRIGSRSGEIDLAAIQQLAALVKGSGAAGFRKSTISTADTDAATRGNHSSTKPSLAS